MPSPTSTDADHDRRPRAAAPRPRRSPSLMTAPNRPNTSTNPAVITRETWIARPTADVRLFWSSRPTNADRYAGSSAKPHGLTVAAIPAVSARAKGPLSMTRQHGSLAADRIPPARQARETSPELRSSRRLLGRRDAAPSGSRSHASTSDRHPRFAGAALVLAACGGDDEADRQPGDDRRCRGRTVHSHRPPDHPGHAGRGHQPGRSRPTNGDAAGPFTVEQIESSEPNATAERAARPSSTRSARSPQPAARHTRAAIALDELTQRRPAARRHPPDRRTPKFLRPGDVDDLADKRAGALALEIDGDARAYPVRIMTWHEIVNDTVGGVPVSVTYCPLCNSARRLRPSARRRADRRLRHLGPAVESRRS